MLNVEKIRSGAEVDGSEEEFRGYRRGALRYQREERSAYDALGPDGEAVLIELREDAPALIEEARMVSAIDHEALAAVRDAGRIDDDRWYVVLERWTGPSLESVLPNQPLDPSDVVALLAPLAPALDRLHEANLTHQGFCAENLVISDPDAPRLWIVGNPSGIAAGGAPDEADTLVLRSPEGLDYLAPDLLDGARRPDVYAFAVLAFRLLSGALPFRRFPTLTQTLVERQERAPASLAAAARRPMPSALERWARTALAPEERRRPPTAAALIADLATMSDVTAGDHEAVLRRLLRGPARSRDPATLLGAEAVALDTSGGLEERIDSIPPPVAPVSGESAKDSSAAILERSVEPAERTAGGGSRIAFPVLLGGAAVLLAIVLVALGMR